jgi:multiple sugar transport system permease protein
MSISTKHATESPYVAQRARLSLWLDRRLGQVMITPAVVLLVVLVIFPTLYLFYLSLSRWDMSSPDPVFVGPQNFIRLFTRDDFFWPAVQRSVIFVVVAIAVEYVLGLAIALLMNRRLRGIGIFRTALLLPMAMTPIVTGMLWLILYNPNYGLINYLLGLVGIQGPDWISNPKTALLALIIVDIWQWTPFMFLVLSAGLAGLPIEVAEAAKVDGANRWQEFWSVTLPLLKRTSLLAILLRIIDLWKVFDTIFALTKGGPGTSTQTLNFYGYLQGFRWFNLGYAAAIMVVAMFAIMFFANYFMRLQGGLLEAE